MPIPAIITTIIVTRIGKKLVGDPLGGEDPDNDDSEEVVVDEVCLALEL
jgi:hypothetical protein